MHAYIHTYIHTYKHTYKKMYKFAVVGEQSESRKERSEEGM